MGIRWSRRALDGCLCIFSDSQHWLWLANNRSTTKSAIHENLLGSSNESSRNTSIHGLDTRQADTRHFLAIQCSPARSCLVLPLGLSRCKGIVDGRTTSEKKSRCQVLFPPRLPSWALSVVHRYHTFACSCTTHLCSRYLVPTSLRSSR